MRRRAGHAGQVQGNVAVLAVNQGQRFQQFKRLAGAFDKGAFVLPFAPFAVSGGVCGDAAARAAAQHTRSGGDGADRHVEGGVQAAASHRPHHTDRAAVHAAR